MTSSLLLTARGEWTISRRAPAKQYVREEIGCALRLSPFGVNARLDTAHELVHRAPQTLDLLEAGGISLSHANCLIEAVGCLDDAAVLEARVMDRASQQTVAQFRIVMW